MLNELAAAPVERLHLPMPGDMRLRKVADAWPPIRRIAPGSAPGRSASA
jgi:hypothetical protein